MYTFVYMNNPMTFIRHKFNIIYTGHEQHTQYVELLDGRYAKTFIKNGEIHTDFIDIQEYASALAYIMLRPTPPPTIPNTTGDLLK